MGILVAGCLTLICCCCCLVALSKADEGQTRFGILLEERSVQVKKLSCGHHGMHLGKQIINNILETFIVIELVVNVAEIVIEMNWCK